MKMHDETIEDLAKDSPCKGEGWCFFKELALHSGLNDRMAEQIRIIYDYKFIQSENEGYDIGIQRASMEFCEQYAATYSDIWHEGITHEELKERLFEK